MAVINRLNFVNMWNTAVNNPTYYSKNTIEKLIDYKMTRDIFKNNISSQKGIWAYMKLANALGYYPNNLIKNIFTLYTRSYSTSRVEEYWKMLEERNLIDTKLKNDLLFHFAYTFQIDQAESIFKSLQPIKPIAIETMVKLYSQIPDLNKIREILNPLIDIDSFLLEPHRIVDRTDYDIKMRSYFEESLRLMSNNTKTKGSRTFSNISDDFIERFGKPKEVVINSYMGFNSFHGYNLPSQRLYRTLIFAFAKNNEHLNCFQIFNWLLQSGKQVHINHVNSLLLSVRNNPIKFEIFDKFCKIRKDVTTYNIMIMNSKKKTQSSLLHDMDKNGIQPNLITKNLINKSFHPYHPIWDNLRWFSSNRDEYNIYVNPKLK
eukprot:NODE_272_length_12196_cov_0.228404.p5 type:complete len:375 gc:universal NODE_272_length_12196_cov_0.228404:3142-2018(-)